MQIIDLSIRMKYIFNNEFEKGLEIANAIFNIKK